MKEKKYRRQRPDSQSAWPCAPEPGRWHQKRHRQGSDNDSLVYGPDAKLEVGEIAIGQVQGLAAALAQKLDATPASSAASGYLSSADWTTFAAKQDAITASSSLTTGSLTTAEQDAVVIKPYSLQEALPFNMEDWP